MTSSDTERRNHEQLVLWLRVPADDVRGTGLVLCAGMTRKTILLVDDSATTLLMEQMVLRGLPYKILTARNGREAIERADAEHPDLILLDVVMPEMNGYEACRRIRQRSSSGSVPIIMVSTRAEEQSVEIGFASGCSDYITKPINGAELLTKIRSYLGS
jgi:CheY-like chemotaxis protein